MREVSRHAAEEAVRKLAQKRAVAEGSRRKTKAKRPRTRGPGEGASGDVRSSRQGSGEGSDPPVIAISSSGRVSGNEPAEAEAEIPTSVTPLAFVAAGVASTSAAPRSDGRGSGDSARREASTSRTRGGSGATRPPSGGPSGGSLGRGERAAFPTQAGGRPRRFFHSRAAGEGWQGEFQLEKGDSILRDIGVATEIFDSILPPEDREDLRAATIVRRLDVQVLRLASGLFDAMSFRVMLHELWDKNKKLAARNEAIEKELAKLGRDRSSEIGELQATLEKRDSEIESLRVQLHIANERTMFAEERAREEERKGKKIGAAAESVKSSWEAALKRSTTLEWEVGKLEGEAARAREEMSRMKGALVQAESQAREAERRAEAAAARGVREYKESDAFEADAAEAGAGLYLMGFQSCKEAVSNAFPSLDLQRILPPGGEDGDAEDADSEGPGADDDEEEGFIEIVGVDVGPILKAGAMIGEEVLAGTEVGNDPGADGGAEMEAESQEGDVLIAGVGDGAVAEAEIREVVVLAAEVDAAALPVSGVTSEAELGARLSSEGLAEPSSPIWLQEALAEAEAEAETEPTATSLP